VVALLGGFGNDGNSGDQVQRLPNVIEQVLRERTDEWMAICGIVGTAIGMCEGGPCIRVFSSVPPEQLRAKIPSCVEGYPVVIEETGAFRALDQNGSG
jgi:hypothetical protein